MPGPQGAVDRGFNKLNDAHTHVGMATGASPGSEARALLHAMEGLGVARAAVITPSNVGGDNSATFDALTAHPTRFVGIALVDWSRPDADRAVAKAVDAGARGIRINLVSEQAAGAVLEAGLEPLWRMLRERGAVVVVHAHPQQLVMVRQLAVRQPELTVLVDHLGRPDVSTSPDSAGFMALLQLSQAPNISVKTPNSSFFSGVPAPHADLVPFLRAALDTFGSHRVLWGSDWPVCARDEPYSASVSPTDLALAGASDAERHAVFAGNFDDIFGPD
ncbi:amidohydrolase [Nostocoides sp. HKS02]|uniref:amidohydrolase family protein n=1 Tax=Nostocoides sp. HKS02 TaxID=1813880 RepID=UPI0012B45812|nr:amidohydrolase family protein [Tetrasphaera sp. HKS02]QGN58801.1 amidohydrolase family protein [Tetrasphaera sp. HKS02]